MNQFKSCPRSRFLQIIFKVHTFDKTRQRKDNENERDEGEGSQCSLFGNPRGGCVHWPDDTKRCDVPTIRPRESKSVEWCKV